MCNPRGRVKITVVLAFDADGLVRAVDNT